mmetsp:Transcript_103295/g.321300  ORF Transcript_103295/g.321300 Transcript_103295/m.321300 type:complete len:295 (+) Transcript_103295:714-1598(+)
MVLTNLLVIAARHVVRGGVEGVVLKRQPPPLHRLLPVALQAVAHASVALDVGHHRHLRQRLSVLLLGRLHHPPSEVEEAAGLGHLRGAHRGGDAGQRKGAEEGVLSVDVHDHLHPDAPGLENRWQRGRQGVEDLLEVLRADLCGALLRRVEGAHHPVVQALEAAGAVLLEGGLGQLPVAAQPVDDELLRGRQPRRAAIPGNDRLLGRRLAGRGRHLAAAQGEGHAQGPVVLLALPGRRHGDAEPLRDEEGALVGPPMQATLLEDLFELLGQDLLVAPLQQLPQLHARRRLQEPL